MIWYCSPPSTSCAASTSHSATPPEPVHCRVAANEADGMALHFAMNSIRHDEVIRPGATAACIVAPIPPEEKSATLAELGGGCEPANVTLPRVVYRAGPVGSADA